MGGSVPVSIHVLFTTIINSKRMFKFLLKDIHSRTVGSLSAKTSKVKQLGKMTVTQVCVVKYAFFPTQMEIVR